MRKILFMVLSLFCFSANAGYTTEVCVRYSMNDGSYSHGFALRVNKVTGDELNRDPYIKGDFSSSSWYFVIPRDDGGYYILQAPYHTSVTEFTQTYDQNGNSWLISDNVYNCY